MPRSRRKLIVVSNRGPYRNVGTGARPRWIRSAGGLVAALDPVLKARGGVWVSAKEAKEYDHVPVEGPRLDYDLGNVKIARGDHKGFYEGVSNAVLWPLMHSFQPTIRVGEAPIDKYVSANRAFAKLVLERSKPADLVWIHDYHLMLVPGLVRAHRKKSRIGWFCHIPWPPAHLYGILPWRTELLEGLLGADVLGFHIEEYGHYFLDCVDRYTDHHVDHDRMTVRTKKRTVQVLPAPIGIPVQELTALGADPSVAAETARIRDAFDGRKIVLGVDRLDYTKGIPERILAFERLLASNRRARAEYVFVQIMVPSRTALRAYADLKDEVDRLVGSINGRYASTGRVPIHYFYRNLDQRTLFAHYGAADVALVTPLRDGMNLVAHEYVASRVKEDGVLVLSEFAGAATHLSSSLLVNPYDLEGVASAVRRASAMSSSERRRRMRALRASVLDLDVHRWADRYLEVLEQGAG